MRFFAVLSLIMFVGCDVDNTSPSADAALPAADAAGPTNALGTECADTAACPDDHNCVKLTSGNPDVGYCSPVCSDETDCADGYTGPSTGILSCFVPNVPNSCSIQCNTTADCPLTLECVDNGGPFKFCTTSPAAAQ